MRTLFDDSQFMDRSTSLRKEVAPVEKLKILEDKIATTIERVKTLKEEKALMERRIKELEELLNEKSQELENMKSEKSTVKSQIEGLLNELESLESE
jgi:chromosome segregation ATPase